MISDAWLRLLVAARHGGRRWTQALRRAGSADALISHNHSWLRRSGLSDEQIARLETSPVAIPAAWRHWLDAPSHELISFESDRYPQRLAELEDPPLALWVTGRDTSLLEHPQVAIVGSRHPTANGRELARSLAAELSGAGITVTSGLALGIDAASHAGAMTAAGTTIAVLGNGIDHVYPRENQGLAKEIREFGLVVSEYPPGTPVRALQFPRRNRIIAGLSLGTVVVEATRRSGSLITARLAVESGREVFAAPGSIHSPLSKGCHSLIRDGATLVETADQILIEIAPQLKAAVATAPAEDITQAAPVLPVELDKHLGYSPITLDSLASATGLTTAELSSMLLHLELQGKIEALPGGRYCRLSKRA